MVVSGLSYADDTGEEQRNWDEGFEAKLEQARHLTNGEPEPGAEPEPAAAEEPAVEPEQEGQPRNPDGTFAPREAESEQEPAEPVAVESEPSEDGRATYLAKYGLDEEAYGQLPDAARKAIDAGFEAQKMVGSRSEEIAELRRLVEERLPADEEEWPEEEYEPPVDPGREAQKIARLVDKGQFREAAIAAYNADDAELFREVRDAWADERPGEVADFLADVKLVEYERQMERRLAPFRQQQATTAFQQAWSSVAREDGRQDLREYADAITEAAREFPEVGAILKGGDPSSMTRAIRLLHDVARGKKGATAQSAAPHAAAQVASEAAAAKVEAAVTSATTVSPPSTAAPKQPPTIMGMTQEEFRRSLTEDTTSVMQGITTD